jgi:amino acid adenylation domain-containing protein
MSYQELNEHANQLARFLRSKGVGAENRVGVCLERSIDMIVCLLGIIKAGGAYVPLEPAWPEARTLEILEDSGAALLLTNREPSGFASRFAGKTIALAKDRLRIRQESSANLETATTCENLLAVVYTSGSTGKPKGVLVTMRPVLNRLMWMRDAYPYRPDDLVLLHRPYVLIGFTTIDCFLPLLSGVPMVILPARDTGDPAAIIGLSTRCGVSHVTASARLWEAILNYVERTPGGWPTLRLAKTGGEPLGVETARLWRRVFPQVPLLNIYGGTEFSSATVYDLPAASLPAGRVPAGEPMPNVRVYVTDPYMRAVPAGETGEICIGGACVARGYLNLPGLTAERFVPDPYSATPGDRLFRSGDMGYWGPLGLEVVGRRDYQVKVSGFRVELGEVEAALSACSGVTAAAVVPHEDSSGNARLVAYIATDPDSVCSLPVVRSALLDRLPYYMVPSRFVVVEEIPLTHTGKIDRRALAATEGRISDDGREFVAPQIPEEQMLAAVWSEVLERDRISVDDDFFELGGDSLLGMQVLARIQEACGVRIPLRFLFDRRTVRLLAEELRIRLTKEQ